MKIRALTADERLPLPASIAYPLGYPEVADLPKDRQEGLRAFWLDGLFASMAGGFADPYYSLYMLSLGANNVQIGLASSLSQVAGAALAIPGASLADRNGHYRRVSLLTGGVSRALWPVMLLAPWLLGQAGAVWLILFACVAIAGVNVLGNAAWTALSADLVPAQLRGVYFASRNIVIQAARLLVLPIAGLLVNKIGEPGGYQFNLGLAFALGGISLYFFSRLPEHPAAKPEQKTGFKIGRALRQMKELPTFRRFLLSHAILNLGVMIGGPFINVYMKEEAGFSVGAISMVTMVGALASILALRLMGPLHHRFGITWTMRFGVTIPLIPVLWLWVHKPWEAWLANSYASLAWAGYTLGAFNLLLASTPDDHRPHYIAIYTTIVSIVAAIGPLIGGWLLDTTGYAWVFGLSCMVRCVGLILFFALVREPELRAETSARPTI